VTGIIVLMLAGLGRVLINGQSAGHLGPT
jgi:hypothetical protein